MGKYHQPSSIFDHEFVARIFSHTKTIQGYAGYPPGDVSTARAAAPCDGSPDGSEVRLKIGWISMGDLTIANHGIYIYILGGYKKYGNMNMNGILGDVCSIWPTIMAHVN